MKKFYEFNVEEANEHYSLNCLLTQVIEDPNEDRNIVDFSKRVDCTVYKTHDFSTYIFHKHISRLLNNPDTIRKDRIK